jgi:hypothetical protein
MTASLTPPECDLRGMPFMPVDLVRLFDSDLYALSTGDEFKAAFTLFGKSFLQVPAGSLPSDDRILAHLSGAGARWAKVRDMALRGWIKCDDGRLYHPVVADKALEAWKARIAQRARTEAARQAKAAQRQGGSNVSGSGACHSVTGFVTDTATTSVTDNVTGSKGQGQGQLSKKESIPSLRSGLSPALPTTPAGPASAAPDARTALFREGLDRAVRLTGKPPAACRAMLGRWLRDAGDDAALLGLVLAEAEASRPADPSAWVVAAIQARVGLRHSPQRQAANTGLRAAALANFQTIRPIFDLESFAEELPQ